MSFDLTRVAVRARGLTHYAKATLMILADRADGAGECWPSQETIAYDTSLSLRQVQRAIKELREAGWIVQQKRFRKDGARISDVIKVNDLEAAAVQAAKQLAADMPARQLSLPLMTVVKPADHPPMWREAPPANVAGSIEKNPPAQKNLCAVTSLEVVGEALRRRGVDAWSCDLRAAEDGSPHHIQGDVRDAINGGGVGRRDLSPRLHLPDGFGPALEREGGRPRRQDGGRAGVRG
jgi:biotin operon repressor